MTEKRIAYSQSCSWWDTIDKADTSPSGRIMRCPHCGATCGFSPSAFSWMRGLSGKKQKEVLDRRGRCDKAEEST